MVEWSVEASWVVGWSVEASWVVGWSVEASSQKVALELSRQVTNRRRRVRAGSPGPTKTWRRALLDVANES